VAYITSPITAIGPQNTANAITTSILHLLASVYHARLLCGRVKCFDYERTQLVRLRVRY
jgi:hypothetical protein